MYLGVEPIPLLPHVHPCLFL